MKKDKEKSALFLGNEYIIFIYKLNFVSDFMNYKLKKLQEIV